jgi:hypothetical protein
MILTCLVSKLILFNKTPEFDQFFVGSRTSPIFLYTMVCLGMVIEV